MSEYKSTFWPTARRSLRVHHNGEGEVLFQILEGDVAQAGTTIDVESIRLLVKELRSYLPKKKAQ